MLDEIPDAGGADETSPLAMLVERIGDLVAAYETGRNPIPDAGPVDVLAFLMEQHGLKQTDLPEIGAPKRCVQRARRQEATLDLRRISALSKRFGISADAFITDRTPT